MSNISTTINNTLQTFITNIFKDGDGYIELRPCRDRGTGIDNRARRWFASPQEFIDKAPSIIEYCRRKYLGCFIGLLPREQAGKGSAEFVGFGRVVWADLDAKDYAGGKKEALEKIHTLTPSPSATVESGGGYHIYYFLDEATAPDTIETINKRLANLVNADHCHDRARVLRLPLSYHCKTEKLIQLRFVTLTEDTHKASGLLATWPACEGEQPKIEYNTIKEIPKAQLSANLQDLLNEHQSLNDYYNGLGKTGGDQSGSGYDYAFAREALYLGASVGEVCDAVACRIIGRNKRVRNDYVQNTVARAKASVDAYKTKKATIKEEPDQYTLERLAKYPKGNVKAGQYIKNRSNLAIILEHDDQYNEVLRYNAFKNRIEYKEDSLHRKDIIAIALDIERRYGLSYGVDMLEDMAVFVAHQNVYHPVRDYLMSLPAKESNALDDWMHKAFGVPNDDMHKAIGRAWAIGAVARIMSPGCFVKNMLILEGAQDIGKSSALKILARHDAWYRDTPFDIKRGDARDAYIKINSSWLYELPEMKSFDKVDANTVKAFISSTTDSYRGFWDKFDKDVPRQCVFIGTTNQKGILHDSTGNVRFWPVHVERVDFAWLEANVDAIWSAAVCAYQAGEKWHISDEIERAMNESREEYESNDDRITLIEQAYDEMECDGATLTLLLRSIGFMPSQITRRVQMNFGELLTRAGWTRTREMFEGRRNYVWRPSK